MAAIAATTFLLGGLQPGSSSPRATQALAAAGMQTEGARRVARALGAVRSAPRDAAAHAQLGVVYQARAQETGDFAYYTRSERSLRRALALDPRNAAAVRGLGSLALARHRFREALALGRRALALAPSDASSYAVIADALLELGRYEAAFNAVDTFVRLEPGFASYARLSYARQLLGNTSGAIAAMRLARDAGGFDPWAGAWAAAQVGEIQLGVGRLRAAERSFRESLVIAPSFAPALAGLADVETTRGRLGRAAVLLRRSLALAPSSHHAGELGDVLTRLGRRRAAERAYAQTAALDRAFAAHGGRVALETAEFDLNHDRRLVDALARARVGYRERPSVEGAHVLAWALYKNDRCAEARRYSIEALRLGTKDADGLYHRSLIERCLGNESGARAFRARVRALDPTYLAAPPSARQVPPRKEQRARL